MDSRRPGTQPEERRRGGAGERQGEPRAAAGEDSRADLLRTLSHDLRTPLTVVLTHAELLRRNPQAGPEDVARRAAAIAGSARRIAAMVSDLVELSQLESGRAPLEVRAIPFAAFAGELLGRVAGGDRVDVEAEADGAVLADLDRLERVVANLVANALKRAPPGTRVTLSGRAGPDGFAISVRDRGPALAPDPMAGRPPGAPRAGLGLEVARLLVEAHGGRLEVESRAGEGVTFRALLPGRARAAQGSPRTT